MTIRSLSLSADGSRVAAGSLDNYVYLLDRDGKLLWKYQAGGWVRGVALSADGSRVAAGSDDHYVRLLDRDGKLLWRYKAGGSLLDVALSADGSRVAAVSTDGYVYLLDRDGKLLWRCKAGYLVWNVALSADGSRVAAVSTDGYVHLLDRDGKLLWRDDERDWERLQQEEAKRRAEEARAEEVRREEARREEARRAEEEVSRLRAEAEAKRRRATEARARLQREQDRLAGVAADLQQRLAPLQRFLKPEELQQTQHSLASCTEKLHLILLPPATELTPQAEGELSQALDGVSQGVRELSNDVERLVLLASSRQAEEEARRAEEERIRQEAATLVQQRSRLQRAAGRAQAQRLWPLVERQAEEAESRGDFALAETLFSQVDVLRQAAAEAVPSTETVGQPPQPVSPQEPAAAFRDNLFALAEVLRENPDFSLDHAFLCALPSAPESARPALEDIWRMHFLAKQEMGKIALIQGRTPEFLALLEARFGLAQTAVQELRRLPSVTADDLLRVLDRTSGEEAETQARRREAIHTQVRRTAQQARTGFPPQLLSVFERPVPLLGGVGGFAVVFRAYHRSLEREVAVKVPAERTPEAGRIFINEASLWADLRHPHIVQVVDHSALPFPYLAMEYMVGGDLQRRLADRGSPFAVAETCRVLLQIAGAVRYAHEERDLIHGDIKASNILVGADGAHKLADWGLSRRSRAVSRLVSAYSPEYAAPEQLRNERRSFKTDVYHLGGVLYHLTTGKAPYDGADSEEQLRSRVLSQPPPKPSQADPSLSPLDDLTGRCMAREPAQRPTIAQLCDALAGLGG